MIPRLSRDAAARTAALYGARGLEWLRTLDALVAELMAEWSLEEIEPPFPDARVSFTAAVRRRDGARLVLKIAPPRHEIVVQARALEHWGGNGAVQLAAVDPARGALLMEHVEPGERLAMRCARDDRDATAAAAELMAGLRIPFERAIPGVPTLASWTAALRPLAAGAPDPDLRQTCAEAAGVADDLLGDAGPDMLLHGDLHHRNILRAERAPWLAIDPKGLIGPREAEVAALLRNPRAFVLSHPDPARLVGDRLAILSERLGDDRRVLAAWAFVLATLAAAWAVEDREEEHEVQRWLACAGLMQRIARARGVR